MTDFKELFENAPLIAQHKGTKDFKPYKLTTNFDYSHHTSNGSVGIIAVFDQVQNRVVSVPTGTDHEAVFAEANKFVEEFNKDTVASWEALGFQVIEAAKTPKEAPKAEPKAKPTAK